MTRRAISIYMAATCAIVIVCPGRLVCGIVIAVELCLLMLFGLLFRAFLSKIKMENMIQSTMLVFIVFLTALFKQFLILIMPELALQLSFILYLPAISTFSTVFLLEKNIPEIKELLSRNVISAGMFSLYILIVAFVRDLFGYGTLTLPAYGRQFEIVIFNPDRISTLSFLATIPGALILTALFLSGFLFVENKFNILKKAGIK